MVITDEALALVRGAIDSKIECWKNLSAAEKAIGKVEISEDDLEDLVTGIESSAQLTNTWLKAWIEDVAHKEED